MIKTKLKSRLRDVVGQYFHLEVEKVFLIISIPIGLCLVFITPPFQGWDETEHTFRAYQISELQITPKKVNASNASGSTMTSSEGYGGYIPRDIVDQVRNLRFNEDKYGRYDYSKVLSAINTSPNYTQKQPVRFDNTSIYSPTAYIPQSIGIALARFFNSPPILILYTARLFELFLWILMIYNAIKYIPKGKKILLVFALNPVHLFIASTLSPDAIAAGLLALTTALILKIQYGNTKHYIKYISIVIIFIILITLIKNVYIPLVLLIYLIPKKYFSKKAKLMSIALILLVAIAWYLQSIKITAYIPDYFAIAENIDSREQILHIIKNPLNFIAVIIWNVFGTNSIIINRTYAGVLALNNIPYWVELVWIGTLAYFTLSKSTERVKIEYTRNVKKMFSVTFIICMILIIGSLYVGWTAVDDKDIMGIQGRYFIPISFLLIPILTSDKLKVMSINRSTEFWVVSLLAFGIVCTLLSLGVRYLIGV